MVNEINGENLRAHVKENNVVCDAPTLLDFYIPHIKNLWSHSEKLEANPFYRCYSYTIWQDVTTAQHVHGPKFSEIKYLYSPLHCHVVKVTSWSLTVWCFRVGMSDDPANTLFTLLANCGRCYKGIAVFSLLSFNKSNYITSSPLFE